MIKVQAVSYVPMGLPTELTIIAVTELFVPTVSQFRAFICNFITKRPNHVDS